MDKKNPKRLRPYQILVMVSAEEKEELDKCSKELGFKRRVSLVSHLLRGKSIYLPLVRESLQKLTSQQLTNNINQIAKRVNSSFIDDSEKDRLLSELYKINSTVSAIFSEVAKK